MNTTQYTTTSLNDYSAGERGQDKDDLFSGGRAIAEADAERGQLINDENVALQGESTDRQQSGVRRFVNRVWSKNWVFYGATLVGLVLTGTGIVAIARSLDNSAPSKSPDVSGACKEQKPLYYLGGGLEGLSSNKTLSEEQLNETISIVNNSCHLDAEEKSELLKYPDIWLNVVKNGGTKEIANFCATFSGMQKEQRFVDFEICEAITCSARVKLDDLYYDLQMSMEKNYLRMEFLGKLCQNNDFKFEYYRREELTERYSYMAEMIAEDIKNTSLQRDFQKSIFSKGEARVTAYDIFSLDDGHNIIFNTLQKALRSDFDSECEWITHSLEKLLELLKQKYFLLKYPSYIDRKLILDLIDLFLYRIGPNCQDYCGQEDEFYRMVSLMKGVHDGTNYMMSEVMQMTVDDIAKEVVFPPEGTPEYEEMVEYRNLHLMHLAYFQECDVYQRDENPVSTLTTPQVSNADVTSDKLNSTAVTENSSVNHTLHSVAQVSNADVTSDKLNSTAVTTENSSVKHTLHSVAQVSNADVTSDKLNSTAVTTENFSVKHTLYSTAQVSSGDITSTKLNSIAVTENSSVNHTLSL
ncbi:MAG: hypothetical protein P857_814 [Candidatus Xenolissoclinum pacificiensis L6]|uniref:Uncharacterized protein n=1 Tax=Candidatus Xenolissoclinum pacificiensis L6 TaxID=1401685 RepID=W2V078_9RICK|nr:MAG: hypothetical protein P857_814 [Candidatus Xenolissoclinum pacificiensis L6]